MLVCPDPHCEHRELVRIAASADDAVVFSSHRAAQEWKMREAIHGQTLGELFQRLEWLGSLYALTGNPKLPSCYRFWRDEFHVRNQSLSHALQRALTEGKESVVEGKGFSERGRVTDVTDEAVELVRSADGCTMLIPREDLTFVAGIFSFGRRHLRFDFCDGPDRRAGATPISEPRRHVTVGGLRVGLDGVTARGICHVRTDDPETARVLGLTRSFDRYYGGEVPASLVGRCFLLLRYCHVGGYRLTLDSPTKDPEVFVLRTGELEAARALQMRRDLFIGVGRRRLRWIRFFHRSDIGKIEEREVPLPLEHLIRAAARR